MRIPALIGTLAMFCLCALATLGLGAPEAASAKSAEWLRRDREIIRQMNQREIAKIRRRDAQYAARNRTSRAGQADYARRRAAYERDMAEYTQKRRRYDVQMAAWREAVADCRAGVRSACRR